jgi:hypothetical protein
MIEALQRSAIPLAVDLPKAHPVDREAATAQLASMATTDVIEWLAMMMNAKEAIIAQFADYETLGRVDLVCRMEAQGAKALPHPGVEIALVPKYTPYIPDIDILNEAKILLPESEAAVLTKFVPAFQPPTPALVAEHYEVGNTNSILAVRDRYPGSPVEALINAGMKRDLIGKNFIFKPRKNLKVATAAE